MNKFTDSEVQVDEQKRSGRADGPSAAVKLRAMKRDRFTCTYCGVTGAEAELEIDHIIPVSRGGSHHISNLTTACRSCNQKKGDRGMIPAKRTQEGRRVADHPLAGLYVHIRNENGCIEQQGHVLGVDGDIALVQLFSWIDGEPTQVVSFQKAFLYSERCTLYQFEDVWVGKAEAEQQAEYEQEKKEERRFKLVNLFNFANTHANQ